VGFPILVLTYLAMSLWRTWRRWPEWRGLEAAQADGQYTA